MHGRIDILLHEACFCSSYILLHSYCMAHVASSCMLVYILTAGFCMVAIPNAELKQWMDVVVAFLLATISKM